MKRQLITLDIKVDGKYGAPNTWDWTELLDLAPHEKVTVVKVEELSPTTGRSKL